MKTSAGYCFSGVCLILFLIFCVLAGGCTAARNEAAAEQPLLQVTPEATPATQDANAGQQPAFGSQTGMTTTVLGHGVTISFPVDWQLAVKNEQVYRDYGRNVLHIADITSPDITSDRAFAATPNPDTARQTTLSVDVDPGPVPDFERYFNLVTLAVEGRYESTEITKRNVVLRISKTNADPDGYKSYELDFDTPTMRGRYIFTNVDGTIYVFAFRNPSPYSKEIENMYKSIVIQPED
jgi:hypothetical protein